MYVTALMLTYLFTEPIHAGFKSVLLVYRKFVPLPLLWRLELYNVLQGALLELFSCEDRFNLVAKFQVVNIVNVFTRLISTNTQKKKFQNDFKNPARISINSILILPFIQFSYFDLTIKVLIDQYIILLNT